MLKLCNSHFLFHIPRIMLLIRAVVNLPDGLVFAFSNAAKQAMHRIADKSPETERFQGFCRNRYIKSTPVWNKQNPNAKLHSGLYVGNADWQGHKDSNSGHAVLETAALPTELYPYIVLIQYITKVKFLQYLL